MHFSEFNIILCHVIAHSNLSLVLHECGTGLGRSTDFCYSFLP